MNRILVVEDEQVIRKQIALLLERNGYEVSGAATIEEAQQLNPESFDLILADIRLPGAPGTEIIQHSEYVPVIVMTSYASVRSAVESMKLGAVDYISKPFDHGELLSVIQRSLRENRLSAQNSAMRRDLQRIFPHADISTNDPGLTATLERLESLDQRDLFVYLSGERGTGKELLARRCHESTDRSRGPLVFADLPAYPAADVETILLGDDKARGGLLQAARGGTLVLRNPTVLSAASQQRLLDATGSKDRRPLNVRLIALAAETLESVTRIGWLIPDLAARFSGISLQVPPLRERREDLLPTARRYLADFVQRYRSQEILFSSAAVAALQAYHWPGNVTELRGAIKRAVLMVEEGEISPAHLGIGFSERESESMQMDPSLDGYFRYFVLTFQDKLSETELAAKLGISRKALWERRQKMRLPRR